MPPYPNASALIRANLEVLQSGQRVKGVAIGTLTAAQLNAINAERAAEGGTLPPILEEEPLAKFPTLAFALVVAVFLLDLEGK
jgi:hypothetical protein